MDFLEIVKTWGDSVLALIVGYFVGRPKLKSEIESTNVDNAGKIMDKWEAYTDRLERVIEQLKETVSELNDALNIATNEKISCEKSLKKLQRDYDALVEVMGKLEEQLNDLKNQNA